MPEYLAPGVYVEETSFRAKSIEGVATSTAGFVGQCRYGPIKGTPLLVTSFEEFQRHFGSLEDLWLSGRPTTNYLAHAVQLFFANGGKRVYIARIHESDQEDNSGVAHGDWLWESQIARFQARFPGQAGNLQIVVRVNRSGLPLVNGRVGGLQLGDVVQVSGDSPELGPVEPETQLTGLCFAEADPNNQRIVLNTSDGSEHEFQDGESAYKISVSVRVVASDGREDSYKALSVHPDSNQFIGKVLRQENSTLGVEPPADRSALAFLRIDDPLDNRDGRRLFAETLLTNLLALADGEQQLNGGNDGRLITDYRGVGSGDQATGLAALGEVEDIAIVAAPGAAALNEDVDRKGVRDQLTTHCETRKYRFAILSAERNLDISGIRNIRGEHDSKYAALYYPWLVVRNPYNATGQGRDTLLLPPDGAIAGIYARSDIERGVHKAPANEVVRSILRFSRNVSKGDQDVLNPEGVNCLRFFEGRGYRVWGARTISSDPEWQYVNVRRLFIYLEHSIDRSTQWAVFEPNNEQLWLKIRLTIESFLYDVWRTGALMGKKEDEAYFVRCDRTTMSQGDLDNGRLVCLIGVAPTKPAEFVVFRIGQWTADASII